MVRHKRYNYDDSNFSPSFSRAKSFPALSNAPSAIAWWIHFYKVKEVNLWSLAY